MRSSKRLLIGTFALGTAAFGGCGGGGDDAVGDDVDASTDSPDADTGPQATRAGTIAVTEVTLTSQNGVEREMKGGVITAELSDLTEGGGEYLIGGPDTTSGCVVIKYDAAHPPHPLVDAGTITVANPGAEESGLLKTVGPCSHQPGQGYLCVSAADSGETVHGQATGLGLASFAFDGRTFTDQDLVGAYMTVNGFTPSTSSLNGGTTPRPVLMQGNDTLWVEEDGPPSDQTITGGVAFAILNGYAPMPSHNEGGPDLDAEFLGQEVDLIRISKPADDDWGAIDFTVYTRGHGFDLDDASAQPHQFPFTAEPVTFSCAGTGGSCGADANQAGLLEATIVSGRTTDVDISATPYDYTMTPTSAATEWASFHCVFPSSPGTGDTIPVDAVTAILSTNPTRIETRVLRVAGTRLTQGPENVDTLSIVVGHGVVGHTTRPTK